MIDANSIQHLNMKIFLEHGSSINLSDAIVVFHRWIRDGVRPELLIDVADYRHVPTGPGVVLIGHQANYSLDTRDDRPGLLYNRKAVVPGAFQDRLRQAHQSVREACNLIAAEPCFRGKLRFRMDVVELSVNDRLLAPNDEGTLAALQPELDRYIPGSDISRVGERRDLFRVRIQAARPDTVCEMVGSAAGSRGVAL